MQFSEKNILMKKRNIFPVKHFETFHIHMDTETLAPHSWMEDSDGSEGEVHVVVLVRGWECLSIEGLALGNEAFSDGGGGDVTQGDRLVRQQIVKTVHTLQIVQEGVHNGHFCLAGGEGNVGQDSQL